MSTLHEELAGQSAPTCKLCAFLSGLSPAERAEWQTELELPVSIIGNIAVLNALKRRGVDIEDPSVRRHRRNHVARH